METAQSFATLTCSLAPEGDTMGRFACLILARNESGVIGRAIESIRRATSPGDALLVVADHCEDDTAEQALSAGATVLVRDDGSPSGKGAALAWFFRDHWGLVRDYPAVLVLDADSLLAPAAGAAIAARLGEGVAYQCRVAPEGYGGSPLATLIALSEIVGQSVHDRLRAKLGWPVRLRGTGMLLPPAVLRAACARLGTEVEDVALTLLLAASGVAIRRLEEAVVFDPKPRQSAAAARQRARWFRGQWLALWRYRSEVLRILLQGPRGWSLLTSLFLKPRWLAAAGAAVLALACSPWPWIAAALWGLLLAEVLALAAGLLQAGTERPRFLRALLYFPSFAFMWIRGFVLLFRRSPWLRTRG